MKFYKRKEMLVFILCDSWIIKIGITEIIFNGCCFIIFAKARYHKFVIFCIVWIDFKNIQKYIDQLVLWKIRI